MHRWLQDQTEDFFFPKGIQALVKRWQTYTECGEDNAEK